METDMNVIEDECAEISVNTEEVLEPEPRGTFAKNERNQMTSFETLIHTALALEEDPRDEHSYAYSDKKLSKESMDKDHCYYSGSKLYCHRKIQSLSDENLFVPAQSDVYGDKCNILPHYRSNDSALDVTGFDTISDKCLSYENIHVKTVDVLTENCILPGVSDPDLSRMTIQSRTDVNTSLSMPNSPASSEVSANDHSYSFSSYDINNIVDMSEQNKITFLKDHAYNNLNKYDKTSYENRSHFLQDHSYGNRKRRDSFPTSVGIKRGRSNDDLSLLASCFFKRKVFSKSPFLDHTYQSVEYVRTNHKSNKSKLGSKTETEIKTEDEIKNGDTSQNICPFKQTLFQNRLLMDHTYEDITDSTADMPLTGFIPQAKIPAVTGLGHIFGEIKSNDSDHSYVIKKQFDDSNNSDLSSLELSDSGTESLNEEDDKEMSASFSDHVNTHMSKWHTEHPYFKTWRSKT